MKAESLSKILLIVLVAAICAGVCPAQTNSAVPANQSTELMGEDDRLPFMQAEQKPEMQESGSGGLILRTLGSMILIVGLIFLGAWGLKKSGFAGLKPNAAANSPDLTVVSTVSLGNGRTISTIRFGEKTLLVGSTAQTFTLLAESAENDRTSAPSSSDLHPRSVADLLAEEESLILPNDFGTEFERAELRLENLRQDGGKLS